MTYASEVLADTPWGFWQQAETTGTSLADSSPGGRPMTLMGTAHTLNQTGPFTGAKAISWANAAGYTITTAVVTTSTVTLEAWVYLTSYTANSVLIGCATGYLGAIEDKSIFLDANGRANFYIYTGVGTYLTSTNPLSLNAWHHVVASVGPSGARIRVDKVTVATNAATTSYAGTAFKVFTRASGETFIGTGAMRIALPAHYTTQLSDARTDAHYNAGITSTLFRGWGIAPI